LLTNGEQLLLTLVIPVAVLLGVTGIGLASVPEAVPGVLTLAVLSSAFTALAISTGFERRSGVLKFLGTTPLARSGLLVGKVAATLVVLAGQWLVLLAVAALLGWRAGAANWPATVVAGLAGTAALGSWGFALAGLLRAEATLAVANGIFLLLMFAGGTVLPTSAMPGWLATAVAPLPTNALHEALVQSLDGAGLPAGPMLILLAWALAGTVLAARTFRWE
jgi:ABC-2 type transport system permease protein